MDGIQTHLRERGWSELKVGCVYQTRRVPDRQRPEQYQIRLEQPSYCATVGDIHVFGPLLWAEAVRRGVLHADEVVVLGALPWDQELDEPTLLAHLQTYLPHLHGQARQWVLDALAIAAYHAQLAFPVVRLLVCDDAPQFHMLLDATRRRRCA